MVKTISLRRLLLLAAAAAVVTPAARAANIITFGGSGSSSVIGTDNGAGMTTIVRNSPNEVTVDSIITGGASRAAAVPTI